VTPKRPRDPTRSQNRFTDQQCPQIPDSPAGFLESWRSSGPRPVRSFGLPKFLAEIFGRNQQPDDDGANDGLGTDLLPRLMDFLPARSRALIRATASFMRVWMGNRARALWSAPKCEPAGSPRQKNPALISSSLHLGQRCSALAPDGQTSSTEATKRLRRRRKLQQSLALRRQSPFQTRAKERLRRHSLQPPSLAS
jgi:hypothetical protein